MKKIFVAVLLFGLLPSYGFAQMSGGGTSEQKGEMKHHGTMMDNTMMKHHGTMMDNTTMEHMDDSHSKLHCAEQWLKKAIQLHELHMKDTTTATNASQMEMMDHLTKAYDCITGTHPSESPRPPKDLHIK